MQKRAIIMQPNGLTTVAALDVAAATFKVIAQIHALIWSVSSPMLTPHIRKWRFGDSAEDGEAWLAHPTQTFVYVDYCVDNGRTRRDEWRRLMVVTKSWLESRLGGVKYGSDGGPLWLAMPAMLVLPDATGEHLRAAVQKLMSRNEFERYSSILKNENDFLKHGDL